MNEVLKENDILLATMLKPDISNMDLFRNDIRLDNTLLLSKDKYKSSDKIRQAFSKDGVFDEGLFDQMYNLAEMKYQSMQEDLLMKDFIDNLEYSKTSFFRTPKDKTYSTEYKGITINNPLQLAIGLEGVNVKSEATKTEKEVAQSHAIWDPISKKWLDESPESQNIFKKAFGESLVYAKYTKDGIQENPVTKETGYHSAGEFITDENGDYFTQLAGDIDLTSNVEVVKLQDILSDEDSWWNKIDFYDSDSKDKSIPGVVMKTVMSTIPYFVPYVGPVYTAASILVGLGENLPQIAKSFDWSPEGSAFSKGCNKVVNWFSKLSPSTSLYGQEHFWSVENLGNLTADIVGQLYQQRGMGYLSLYLTKTNKYIKELEAAKGTAKSAETLQKYIAEAERQGKIAKALSLGYMSIIQAGDVYNDALNAGYSRGVAGVATLMSTAAFFGIMNYNEGMNGIGTWFLDKTTGYDREILKAPAARLAKKSTTEAFESPEMKRIVKEDSKNFGSKMRNYWLNFWSKVDDAVRIGAEGAWTGAIAEGAEEVSEEVVQDGVKGLIDGLSYLGFRNESWGREDASFGGWSNVFSKEGLLRYFETFVGGAMGGAMFHVTLHKIKPMTDALFGILSDVPKPVEYDKYDIALLGEEEEYYRLIDKAVKFIDDRELDLGNPEDAKIYKAREAIAATLKNEMKAIVDLVHSITAGADFNLINSNYRDMIRQNFKPLIKSSGAIEYVASKWKYNVGLLANVLQEILSRLKDLESNKDGLDAERTKEIIKHKKEEAKTLRELVLGYFTGQSYIDTHDEASWLADKELLKSIHGLLTPREYYENVLKPKDGREYEDLVEVSTDPNEVSKQLVAKLAEDFNKELEHQFDSSLLPDLYLRLPIINKAFKAMARLIGPDTVAYLNEERKRAVVAKAIKKMQQDRQAELDEINSLDLISWLTPEGRLEYITGDETKKESIINEALDARTKRIKEINEGYSIKSLLDFIKNDPNAFSLADRRAIDYFDILQSKGVISLTEYSHTEGQIDTIKALVNSEFANTPLSTLSKKNVLVIFDNIMSKLHDEGEYWGKRYKQDAEEDETAALNENPNLDTFDVFLDKFDDSIEFMKLTSIEEFFGEDQQYISKEAYDFLLAEYLKLDSLFLSKLMGVENDIDDAIDAYLRNPSIGAQSDVVNAVRQEMSFVPESAINILAKLGADELLKQNPLSPEAISWVELTINNNLRSASFIAKYGEKERVENNFVKAIDKIAFSIIGDPRVVRGISKLVADWEKSLKTNEGLQINSTLTKEALDHLQDVLTIFATAVSTMAPTKSDDGLIIESILQRNQNFAKSMGSDGSEYFVLGEEEGDLMKTIIREMSDKIEMLKRVLGIIEEELSTKFEKVRQQMLDNLFKLFRFHLARRDYPLYILEIADEIEAEGNKEFSYEEKAQKIFEYQLAIYNRLREDSFGGDEFKLFSEQERFSSKSREEKLVAFLMDKYGKSNGKYINDVFYTSDPATIANDQNENNGTYASYLLTELVGLVGLDNDHSPKAIQDALQKAFTDLGLYPRLDLTYSLQLIAYGIIGKKAYSEFGKILESWYNDKDSDGATKLYIQNLIKVFGPAGSGKTALYSVLVKALEHLGYKKSDLPIAITALSEYKVQNIKEDLSGLDLKDIHYSPLYNIITNLQNKSGNWKILETKLISLLNDKSIREKIKRTDGEWTTLIDPNDEKYGSLKISKSNEIFTMQLYGGKEDFSDFDVNIKIAEKYFENDAAFIGDLIFEFNGKSFDGIEIAGTSLDNGLLIIDECTNLNPFEWLVLNKLAREKNFNILATGDLYQRGYAYQYKIGDKDETKRAYIGAENVLGLETPVLLSIHRSLCSAVEHNEHNIRNISDIALRKADNKGHEGLHSYTIDKNEEKEINENLAALKLEYTLENDSYGFLGANITHTQQDLQKTIEKIKDPENKKNQTFLIITNSDTDSADGIKNILTSQGFKPENIRVISKDNVQGAEADYAIAMNISASNSTLSDLKEIYTLVTRGRYGFISFGGKDLFQERKVQSTSDKPVVVISKSSVTDKKAKEWLESWRKAIDATADKRPEGHKEETIPVLPVKDEPAPESEESREKKLTDNISLSFKDVPWVIARQYGYMLGLSLKQIDEIKGQDINEWRDSVKGTSFGAFVKMFETAKSERKILCYSDDVGEISRVLGLDSVKPKNTTGLGYIDSFITFVNIMRESYKYSKMHGVSFMKLAECTEDDKRKNPNISYLKRNDDPNKSKWGPKTWGVPLVDGNNVIGHIILGVISYDKKDDGTSSYKGFADLLWLEKLEKNLPVLRVYSKDEAKKELHTLNLLSYYDRVNFNNVRDYAENHKGAIAAITNLRDWFILSDWQGNVSEDHIALGRESVDEMLAAGYEFVDPSVLKRNGGRSADFNEFMKWYNSHRWSDVADEKRGNFESTLSHNGSYYVIRPRGTSEKGFPILIKHVISWEDFISHGGANNGNSEFLSEYAALNIIYAAAKKAINDKLLLSDVQKILTEKPREGVEVFLRELASKTEVKPEVFVSLYNCVQTGFKFVNNEKVDDNVMKGRTSKYEFDKTLLNWLNKNVPNYPFENIGDTTIDRDEIITRTFEPENFLIDLSMLEDPSVKPSGDVGLVSVFGEGLNDGELEELDGYIKTAIVKNNFKITLSDDPEDLNRLVENAVSLLEKASYDDIVKIAENNNAENNNVIINAINNMIDWLNTPGHTAGVYKKWKAYLINMKDKILSDKEISKYCIV